ncbi:MAG: hypothetical protein HRT57_01820 [Crocinitomicaceae bacterium]|nr:hypothetical protein [Crocinitomicaceae bacterium]
MILVIDCGSDTTTNIAHIVDDYCDVKSVPLLDLKIDEDLKEIKGVIISSGSILLTEVDPDRYLEKLEWIKETELPVLGINLGHVLIGLLFGGYASRTRNNGDWETIEAYEDCILFNRLPNEIEARENSSETVSIAPEFQLVASSDGCVNEVMQHKEKAIFGVQFHPEISGNHGAILIENFVNHCIRSPYH